MISNHRVPTFPQEVSRGGTPIFSRRAVLHFTDDTGYDQDGKVADEFARINLIGVKESRLTQDGHDQHASFWDNIANTGSYTESLVMPEIHLTGRNEDGSQAKAELAAPGGLTVGAVALAPTQYELAKAATGSEVSASTPAAREKAKTVIPDPVWTCAKRDPKQCAWVTPPDLTLRTRAASLAKTPGLEWLGDAARREDVDWQQVELAAKDWDYKHAGLTKEGAAVVVIVVAILTWGAASSAGTGVATEAGMTTATGSAGASGVAASGAGVAGSGVASGTVLTTTGAAVSAGIAAGITTLAGQAAVSLINNHGDIGQTLNDLGSSESVKQVVAAMLTAGLVQGATTAFNLPNPAATTAFVDRFATYATQAAVKAGVHSAIYGEPLSETMKAALVSSLAQSLTAEVGDLGKQYGMEPGSLAKMLAHAVVQCAAASALNQDCGSAALGGAIAEALSPIGNKLDQSDYAKDNKLGGQLGNAIASMTSILVADLMGKDTMTAAAAASMVDSYNRQLHQDERILIRKLAAAKAEEGCRGDADCIGKATVYWSDAMERVAESRIDDNAYAKNAGYLTALEKTGEVGGTVGQTDMVERYFADLKTASEMLAPYNGKPIVINGQVPILDGSEQTYFSATEAQRADFYGNTFGGSPSSSIVPGMEARDQTRLEYFATADGSAQPLYLAEELLIGGAVSNRVATLLGRVLGQGRLAGLGEGGANLSTKGIPGIDKPFRQSNATYPPNAAVVEKMNSLPICGGTDCSEIASLLRTTSGDGGVLRVTGQGGNDLRLLEYGKIDSGFKYHEVFTDGRYVYDPRLSNRAVPLGDWIQMIRGLNPGAEIK